MAQKYFEDLNYSMANEDTALEQSISQERLPKKILSICGSGSRCLPLINSETSDLYMIDFSKPQLYLSELRAECFKNLSYENYLKFWGYAPYKPQNHTPERQKWFQEFDLSSEAKSYLLKYFEFTRWNSLLYEGKWEKTFIKFSKVIKKVLGKHSEKALGFSSLEEQKQYFKSEFPWWRWNIIVSIIGNKALFNLLLYKGDFVVKNVENSYFDYYSTAFKKLFSQDLAQKSFFIQLLLRGIVTDPVGNINEAQENSFNEIKKNIQNVKLHYLQGDFLTASESLEEIDFISMSNVPSYLSGDIEKNHLNGLSKRLSSKGCIVSRYYLRVPDTDRSQYQDITKDFQEAINNEKVQMYQIEILEKKA